MDPFVTLIRNKFYDNANAYLCLSYHRAGMGDASTKWAPTLSQVGGKGGDDNESGREDGALMEARVNPLTARYARAR